jgi:putative endopeptidase
MRLLRVLPALLVLALPLIAQQTTPPTTETPQKMPRFAVDAIDKTVDPCVNFYKYACGNWQKNNPIPPDQSAWGRFSELYERNQTILRGILEEAAAKKTGRSVVEQKIGDFYSACMDEATIDKKGLAPLQAELDRIQALQDKKQLAAEIARIHSITLGFRYTGPAGFVFLSEQDPDNSAMEIAELDQGGMGLPDRDYYFKDDAKSVEQRNAYAAHVEQMFTLMGEPADQAKADAQTVMTMETALAKAALDLVTRRDPHAVYHRMKVGDLQKLTPDFDWSAYFKGVGAPGFTEIDVREPEFYKALNAQIGAQSLDHWKTYLRWHLVHGLAPMLPPKFVQADFEFYSHTLNGAEQIRPRWKRCVSYTDTALGEALGQRYVEKTFGAEGKRRTLQMVNEIEAAMAEDLKTLDWMTPATKEQAFVKLRAIANKIGYPDKWRDYSKLNIVAGDALGNSERGIEFEFHRQLNKIGKPVDRAEWEMTPPTVNAYYDPQMNNINFPAGILQPPFYDNEMDDAVNYGGIGAVVGHELTHGFDDQGAEYDAQGNLKNWWTPQDKKAFEERTGCEVDEYNQFLAYEDPKDAKNNIHVNGKLTLGENTADNGGLRLAYMALVAHFAGQQPPEKDGYTPEQRTFLGWGQIWCTNYRPDAERSQALTDPHAPSEYRVNGVVRNMPEFQKAFNCKAGQPMAPEKRCRVW